MLLCRTTFAKLPAESLNITFLTVSYSSKCSNIHPEQEYKTHGYIVSTVLKEEKQHKACTEITQQSQDRCWAARFHAASGFQQCTKHKP